MRKRNAEGKTEWKDGKDTVRIEESIERGRYTVVNGSAEERARRRPLLG